MKDIKVKITADSTKLNNQLIYMNNQIKMINLTANKIIDRQCGYLGRTFSTISNNGGNK